MEWSPGRNQICCIFALKSDIWGNNFNNFPENQVTKYYKTFLRAKATTNYIMHDLKLGLTLLTIGVTLNHAFNAIFSVACVVGSCHCVS